MKAIVLMGVCGTGKTTIGQGIASALNASFLEGDSFHPPENILKMRSGVPLDDDDRWPWLETLGRAIGDHVSRGDRVVAACSALKRIYRDRLREAAGADLLFIFLDGDPTLLSERMSERTDHYMPPALLSSQLAILERPDADEISLTLNVSDDPKTLIEHAVITIDRW